MTLSVRVAVAAWLLAASAGFAEERVALSIEGATGPVELSVEVADDSSERARGLMFRREMGLKEGMLFDFGEERPVSMWMKNTVLPLDMLFIGADGVVKTIARRTTPFSERTIPSGPPVRYVLEINGGAADRLGLKEGDRVGLPGAD